MSRKRISDEAGLVEYLDSFPPIKTFEYAAAAKGGRAGRKPAGAWATLPRGAASLALRPGVEYVVRPVGETASVLVCLPIPMTAEVVRRDESTELAPIPLEQTVQTLTFLTEHQAAVARNEAIRAQTQRTEAATLAEWQGMARSAHAELLALSQDHRRVSRLLMREREDSGRARALTYAGDILVEKVLHAVNGYRGATLPDTVASLVMGFGPQMRGAAEQFILSGAWHGVPTETERFYGELCAWIRVQMLSGPVEDEEGEEGEERPDQSHKEPEKK